MTNGDEKSKVSLAATLIADHAIRTVIRAESERLAEVEKDEALHNRSTAPSWRIVERRLQALRKTGKIRATTRGWVLAEPSRAE
ncbi:TPA: hypothetical protein QDA91_004390 [Burkholderia vietnamiensis]|nr:hypothetical protein [Burkholderia vietnamiensis]